MVGVVDAFGTLVIVLVNSAATALLTRFFRVRLDTEWGSAVYTLLLCPLVMFVLLLVLSGVLGLGADLGGTGPAVLVTLLLPFTLGVTVDYFWMPAPGEVEVPDTV